MRELDAFNAITRRGLRIHYVSPLVCFLPSEASGSGSSAAVIASLDIDPVVRLPGPTDLAITGTLLTWVGKPYIFSYVVYFATDQAGPFQLLTSNVQELEFDASGLPAGDYFFKVTGIEPTAGETLPSSTIGPATIP